MSVFTTMWERLRRVNEGKTKESQELIRALNGVIARSELIWRARRGEVTCEKVSTCNLATGKISLHGFFWQAMKGE